MRIFLCGGGDGYQTINAYNKLNEIIDHTKPLLYIPLAMESDKYSSCYEWITNELKNLNIPSIEMVNQASEITNKKLEDYCAIFIGGGNTFKLLNDLKRSGAFDKIKLFINNNGIIFGGSAGAIIFGKNLKSCTLDDDNAVNLKDISGYDVLNGYSILCHYTNRTQERDEESKNYLLNLSKEEKIIALPEEDTIYINDNNIEVIGNRPYYIFDKGAITERNPKLPEWQFGTNNDNLVELVLKGIKTATTSLDTKNVPRVGERSILKFENEKKACIVETKKVVITKFKNITSEMAFLEGEGNRTLDYYKKAHMDYFKTINPNFNDETEVCFEISEVIEDLRGDEI
jgi:dipeptidase E